jgi:hypothetical protein
MDKWGGVKWQLTGLILLSLILSFLSIQPAQAADCATTTSSSGSTRYVKITSASGCTWLIPSGVTSLDFVLVGGGDSDRCWNFKCKCNSHKGSCRQSNWSEINKTKTHCFLMNPAGHLAPRLTINFGSGCRMILLH